MSKQGQNEVLGEIERLDGELQRITRELEALRRRVEGPNRTGRTQAFAGISSSLPPPDSVTPSSEAPSSRAASARTAAQSAPASARPRPSPTIPPKTGTRPISDRATAETAPGQPAAVGSGRRAAGPSVGLEHEPSSPPPRSRESPTPREAGRYEFVQEAKPRSSTRR